MSALGVKQTSQIRPVMSAYDPKRTWARTHVLTALVPRADVVPDFTAALTEDVTPMGQS
jgi:hypothetical protein